MYPDATKEDLMEMVAEQKEAREAATIGMMGDFGSDLDDEEEVA